MIPILLSSEVITPKWSRWKTPCEISERARRRRSRADAEHVNRDMRLTLCSARVWPPSSEANLSLSFSQFISFGSARRRHQSLFGAAGWHHRRSLAALCVQRDKYSLFSFHLRPWEFLLYHRTLIRRCPGSRRPAAAPLLWASLSFALQDVCGETQSHGLTDNSCAVLFRKAEREMWHTSVCIFKKENCALVTFYRTMKLFLKIELLHLRHETCIRDAVQNTFRQQTDKSDATSIWRT